jgi:ZipA, C-terminal FtsZ-binding domain
MSDLVIGLLVLGAVVFAGVLVYNRVQVRSVQRASVSIPLEEPALRREPTLAPSTPPDERVDYVIELESDAPLSGVREGWRPLAQRFGRRALLDQDEGGVWRAALQLVNRAGPVSEADLAEFRSGVETLAARVGARVAAPELARALDAARELDRLCADSDIQVALHVIGENIEPDLGRQPFQVVRREDGVTLTLDVALSPDLGASYEAMTRAGRALAATHGAKLVDDRGNALDERALESIGAQLEAVRQILAARGIETGSPLAQRLFS